MADSENVWYVYGVVPVTLGFTHAPSGLDEAKVEPIPVSALAAVVSRLDADQYAPAIIERRTADMEWLAPRAVAHDRVLTWASDRGPVVPLPMFSLFSSERAVRSMLDEQRTQLHSALERAAEGREYALRVYRMDEELATVAAELSPRLAELQRAASTATPGQRYLLERKLDTERKTELRALGARIAGEIMSSLRPFAVSAVEGSLISRAATGATENPLVLDAAFLIATTQLDRFRQALTALVQQHGARGFRFDFTGPWPPYHFVQTPMDSRADEA